MQNQVTEFLTPKADVLCSTSENTPLAVEERNGLEVFNAHNHSQYVITKITEAHTCNMVMRLYLAVSIPFWAWLCSLSLDSSGMFCS